MNIIETVQTILEAYPQIQSVRVNYVENADDFGISPNGDSLMREDCIGSQHRAHSFTLYCKLQSMSDYDRLNDSGILLSLQAYLETAANMQAVSYGEKTGTLTKITCENGMLIEIPSETLTEGWTYQMQVNAEYEIPA